MDLRLVVTWRWLQLEPGDPRTLRRVKKGAIRAGLGALLAAAGAAAIVSYLHRPLHYGAVHLTLQLPWKIPPGSEPLLVTGRTGAADVVYVHYLTDRSLQVGFDEWGVGGGESAPIHFWPGEVVEIDLAEATLFDRPSGSSPRAVPGSRALAGRRALEWEVRAGCGLPRERRDRGHPGRRRQRHRRQFLLRPVYRRDPGPSRPGGPDRPAGK